MAIHETLTAQQQTQTLAPSAPTVQPQIQEDAFDRWRRETIARLKQSAIDNRFYYDQKRREIEARKQRLLIDFHFDRNQWIRDNPGRNNPYLWVEYDRKTGKLLPIEQSLHI